MSKEAAKTASNVRNASIVGIVTDTIRCETDKSCSHRCNPICANIS